MRESELVNLLLWPRRVYRRIVAACVVGPRLLTAHTAHQHQRAGGQFGNHLRYVVSQFCTCQRHQHRDYREVTPAQALSLELVIWRVPPPNILAARHSGIGFAMIQHSAPCPIFSVKKAISKIHPPLPSGWKVQSTYQYCVLCTTVLAS